MIKSQERTKGNLYDTGLGNDSMDIGTKTQTKKPKTQNPQKTKKQKQQK